MFRVAVERPTLPRERRPTLKEPDGPRHVGLIFPPSPSTIQSAAGETSPNRSYPTHVPVSFLTFSRTVWRPRVLSSIAGCLKNIHPIDKAHNPSSKAHKNGARQRSPRREFAKRWCTKSMNRNAPSPTALAIVRQIFAQEARARKPSGASNNRGPDIGKAAAPSYNPRRRQRFSCAIGVGL